MNAIFTIVAKNYLPLAYTLQKSIAIQNPDIQFFIFISDKKAPTDVLSDASTHYYLDSLDISEHLLNDLAFKYNITEFCTCIKPSCFQFLYNKGFDHIIYFDPDIFVYQSINFIYDHLSSHFLVITPHYCRLEQSYSGFRSEGIILFSGVYNLGFCAVKMDNDGKSFIAWWKERLFQYCYADKTDGLNTDQKWIDIVHCIFDGPIKVLKHPGTNAAIWNMHERMISKVNDQWLVRFKDSEELFPLVFFHYSSFTYYADNMPNKLFPAYRERFPYIIELAAVYRNELMKNGLIEYKKNVFSFDIFNNGDPITALHRRFYRRLTDLNLLVSDNPFKVGIGSFHQLLKSNNLLFEAKSKGIEGQNELNMPGFDSKVHKINLAMSVFRNLIGIERYFLLIKFFQRYFRFENQYFLIKEFRKGYKFLNEGRSVDQISK